MACGIVRLHQMHKLDFADLSGSAYFPCVWAMVEASVGIFVACAPLLRPVVGSVWEFFKRIKSTISGTVSNAYSRYQNESITITSRDDVRLPQLPPRSFQGPKITGSTSLTSHPPSPPDLWSHLGTETDAWQNRATAYGAGTQGTTR